MKPSNFTNHPYDSVMQNYEAETVARNIMVILSRTGNTWRPLSLEEYTAERQKDGKWTEQESALFGRVSRFCLSAETANCFSQAWNK